jgi:hypothetical protein
MRGLARLDDVEVVGAAVRVDGDVGRDARGCGLDREGTPARHAVELEAHRVARDDRADGLALAELDGGDPGQGGDDAVDLPLGPGGNPDAVVMRAGARRGLGEGCGCSERQGLATSKA